MKISGVRFLSYLKFKYIFLCNIRKQALRIRGKKMWSKTFCSYLSTLPKTSCYYQFRWKLIEGFTKSNIKIIKRGPDTRKQQDPILISIMRNEIERIEVFLKHYREMGIQRFAIMDNASTDGTFEYLRKQKDVDLFFTNDKFQSETKPGWINRIISYYGISHWFLVADADELLVWQGIEDSCVQNVIAYLDKKKATRARALMIDMYPEKIGWNSNNSFKDIFPQCKYFDNDSYYHEEAEELYLMCGGPRKRMLGVEAWLTKYPLFRLKEGEILANVHSIYPYNNGWTPCFLAILHYKFLTKTDLKKAEEYVNKENYAGGSAEYKIYMQKQKENIDNFNFYNEQSIEYKSSESLSQIREMRKIKVKL